MTRIEQLLSESYPEESAVERGFQVGTQKLPSIQNGCNALWKHRRQSAKKEDIMRACDDTIRKPKKCQEIDPDEQIFGDLRTIDDDVCNEDGTFATETQYQPVLDPIYNE